MEENHIKNYWENQGKVHNESHWASWGDNWMIDLEIETISEHINNNDKVLDVGCANGYSTFNQLKKHNLNAITGVDFAENMIHYANESLKKNKCSNVNFEVGDVRNLKFSDNTFDVVYTTRVIINLPTWEEQINAIKECIRVAKSGGTIVLCEGFWEPLVKLNALRTLANLEPLAEHDFNRYLKKNNVKKFLNSLNLDFEIVDFSSIYYIGSRFLRELVTDYTEYEGFSNPINAKFASIQKDYKGGEVGIQQAIIIKKI
jgi:ubiquinone/menaquinone biosynthesis C-methylase UbiE